MQKREKEILYFLQPQTGKFTGCLQIPFQTHHHSQTSGQIHDFIAVVRTCLDSQAQFTGKWRWDCQSNCLMPKRLTCCLCFCCEWSLPNVGKGEKTVHSLEPIMQLSPHTSPLKLECSLLFAMALQSSSWELVKVSGGKKGTVWSVLHHFQVSLSSYSLPAPASHQQQHTRAGAAMQMGRETESLAPALLCTACLDFYWAIQSPPAHTE